MDDEEYKRYDYYIILEENKIFVADIFAKIFMEKLEANLFVLQLL